MHFSAYRLHCLHQRLTLLTPLRPEVHENRMIGFCHFVIEITVGNRREVVHSLDALAAFSHTRRSVNFFRWEHDLLCTYHPSRRRQRFTNTRASLGLTHQFQLELLYSRGKVFVNLSRS